MFDSSQGTQFIISDGEYRTPQGSAINPALFNIR